MIAKILSDRPNIDFIVCKFDSLFELLYFWDHRYFYIVFEVVFFLLTMHLRYENLCK